MKLLGWMHSKLKQKGNEPANNTTIVGNSISSFSAHREVKSNNGAEEEQFDEIFPGFLAIGTLGNYQPTNTDPPTPTFPMPFEHVETDITEKELKFINDELEKFLEEKVINEVAYEPSERTIALSDKHIETECYGNMEECPLQKYLFGSSVELPEIESQVKQQKGFLEEIFKRKNIVQESHVGNEGKEKKQRKRKLHAAHFMKKMLQNLQVKSKSSTTAAASSKGNIVTGSVSSKRKLPRVLKMFHRKVHPVNENKLQDNESSNIISFKTGNLGAISEVNTKFSPAPIAKKEVTIINREHWIKTDSDCK
ncbi:hypothetical protein HAX54_036089 [Datura stramonium]|uniref:Protein LAZY 1-like n=1 Tax=Datura stramonium TaxID=4076 RepID=A0ABS8VH36_DATST|nr:hypothetical protein [Datura stramonium]